MEQVRCRYRCNAPCCWRLLAACCAISACRASADHNPLPPAALLLPAAPPFEIHCHPPHHRHPLCQQANQPHSHQVTYQQQCNVRTSPTRGTIVGCHGLALTRLREHKWVQTLSLCTPQLFLSTERSRQQANQPQTHRVRCHGSAHTYRRSLYSIASRGCSSSLIKD